MHLSSVVLTHINTGLEIHRIRVKSAFEKIHSFDWNSKDFLIKKQ